MAMWADDHAEAVHAGAISLSDGAVMSHRRRPMGAQKQALAPSALRCVDEFHELEAAIRRRSWDNCSARQWMQEQQASVDGVCGMHRANLKIAC